MEPKNGLVTSQKPSIQCNATIHDAPPFHADPFRLQQPSLSGHDQILGNLSSHASRIRILAEQGPAAVHHPDARVKAPAVALVGPEGYPVVRPALVVAADDLATARMAAWLRVRRDPDGRVGAGWAAVENVVSVC